MTRKIEVLSPAAEAWRPDESVDVFVDDLAGKTVAILNNRWTSMDVIADYLTRLLKEEYGVTQVFQVQVPIASPPPQEVFDEVVERADLAVVGLAN